MSYLVTEQQKLFFQTKGFLQIEDFFSDKELHNLRSEVNSCSQTRGLYLENKQLFALVKKRTITSFLLQLIRKESMRFATDLVLDKTFFSKEKTSLFHLLPFHELYTAVIIPLFPHQQQESFEEYLFPTSPNVTLFCSAKKPLDFSFLQNDCSSYYALIYGELNLRYKENNKDPNSNFLKNLGYGYGDRLEDRTHPSFFSSRSLLH